MEFEKAVLEWCGPLAYMAYETWARERGFPAMREEEWRAKCIAAAIMAAAEAEGQTLAQAQSSALEALRGVGSVRGATP